MTTLPLEAFNRCIEILLVYLDAYEVEAETMGSDATAAAAEVRVEYDICTGNIVLSVLFCETVVAPVLLTGLELWEPVSYTEPKTTEADK